MNYFFGSDNNIYSELVVPKFRNKFKPNINYKLVECFPEKNEWKYKLIENCKHDDNFYFINEKLINSNNFFFLARKEEFYKFNSKNLENINSYTNTEPAFRANLKFYFEKNSGFSSYQSEYPYEMTKKRGSILSSISSLTNKDADHNFLLLRNIYFEPIIKNFEIFFVDIFNKKIVYKTLCTTNTSNFIKISNKIINENIYIFTKEYLGIPIFISEKNKHLSCEHTHPPHEYILSENKFAKVRNLKEGINEIIYKENI